MAPSEVKTLHECQAMKHGAMMKNRNCMALQKKYPGVLKTAVHHEFGRNDELEHHEGQGVGLQRRHDEEKDLDGRRNEGRQLKKQ